MDEEEFLAEMVANPNDPEPRLLMADWLEDRDDPRAELMRIQEQLRSIDVPDRKDVESRMQQLLREGVKPVVPRMTNALGMRFVFIFPGEFLMGDEEEDDEAKQSRQQITEGFWLGETVVTQGQWQSVMQSEPWKDQEYTQQHADCPATHVNWEEATEFCRHLSEQESPIGKHYTLPADAQWEYACLAGTTSTYSFGDEEAELDRYAWFSENALDAGKNYAHRVGQKLPNPWGLFDVHGNVFEWCQDAFDEDGSYRVFRGGSWYFTARDCRSSYRDWYFPTIRYDSLGFRVASVPSSESSKKQESGAESEGR